MTTLALTFQRNVGFEWSIYTRILDTMNYTNKVYVHVKYTLIVIYSMLLVTDSQSKNVSCFCLDMAQ
jgi:hypothetical protein